MAGSAVIGALRVVLGADTAAFESGLKGAQSKMDSFGAGMAKAGAAIGVAMAAAATALGVAIKHSIDEADKLGKMAQKIGVPVEELSALKHAADLSGVSLDALGQSMGKLSKAMVEAAAKPTSEAANAFRALGVSVTNADGTLKTSSQVISDVAGKFEGLKDGAGKTAVAMAIFGKSGKDMIPLLNAGRDGLQEMKDEAAKLGIVIDNQTAKSAEAFNDNLTRLGKVKDGIILKITAGMLPAMEQLSAVMVKTAKDSDGLKLTGEILGGGMKVLATVAMGVSLAFKQMALDFVAVAEVAKLIGSGEFSKAKEAFVKWQEESKKLNKDANDAAAALWNVGNAAATFAERFGNWDAPAKKLKDFNFAALAGKTAIDGFLDSTNKSLAAQNAELLTTGLATGAKEGMRVQLQALAIAQAGHITLTDKQRQKISEMATRVEEMTLKLKGSQLVLESKEPHEKYRIELENNELAMRKFGATSEEISRMQQQHAEKYGNTWGQVGESVAGSFVKIGESFGKENKAMAMVAKVAGIIQGTISMFTGAAKALELPFPANLAAMASVLATGAGLVASIKSTSTGGFKTGGAIVPGGMGGGDRVRAMVDLEPGEQLDVWRPGDAGGDPRRGMGGGDRTITIRFEGDDLNIGQKMARKIAQALNEALGDGVRLRMA